MENKLRGNDFWGEGIPDYEKEDLMSKREILDFSIDIVLQFGTEKDGYEVISVDNKINANPNIVLKKEGKLYYVLVRGDDVHHQPTINENEKNILIENSIKANAIPLFASVGIGSTDPLRFEAKLLLRNDGFYANFTGYEEIKCTENNNDPKTEKYNNVLKKEIGSLYVHYLEEKHGHYNSFRNFCCSKMVFLSFAYGRNGVHISATPDKYKISKESSDKIRDIVKNEFRNLKPIQKTDIDNLDSYISIVYIDDTTEYYEYNEKIAKSFELREKIKEGYDVISEPYLIFNDSSYNKNVRSLSSIIKSIENKKIDEIIAYLASDFEIKIKFNKVNKTIVSINELKQMYRKFAGLFGSKLASHHIFTTKLGALENGIAKVNIGVEVSGKNYRLKCICSFNFNNGGRITSILIEQCNDIYRAGKILTDDDIKQIVSGNYNDTIDKEYDDIQETNEDPNSIYRIQK